MSDNRAVSWLVPGTEIPEAYLRALWEKHFADKPFPQVRAFKVKKKELIRIMVIIGQLYPETKRLSREQDIKEYGESSRGDENTRAFLLSRSPPLDVYIIFTRANSHHRLEEDLEHEFRHVYEKKWKELSSGEVETERKQQEAKKT